MIGGRNIAVFEDIKKQIINDTMNIDFTKRKIHPLFKASRDARIVIVGQAPGRRAEKTHLFWNDPSGDRLRQWMGISREDFYNTNAIAHLPMDFYYPGKAKTGDKPPRKGFAEKWHPPLLKEMPRVKTIILVGAYAQKYYLADKMKANLTETVRSFREYLPLYLPLVHPFPLNHGWLKRNPWFEREVIPVLRKLIDKGSLRNQR